MSEIETVQPVRGRNAKTIAVVTIFAALVAGAILGAIGDRLWMMHRLRQRTGTGPHAMAIRLLGSLDRQLDLSPAQEQQVQTILESHASRIAAISATTRPQIRQEIERANAEVERVLTPDQREKFRRLRMHMRMRGGGPPPRFGRRPPPE